MALYELHMPQMGESILEATVLKWMVGEGDEVSQDDIILEVATDKVDSEIPSPVSGKVKEIHVTEGEQAVIGAVIAILEIDDNVISGHTFLMETPAKASPEEEAPVNGDEASEGSLEPDSPVEEVVTPPLLQEIISSGEGMKDEHGKFFSPLVRNIAKAENISARELLDLKGTGVEGKITKADVLDYLHRRDHEKKKGAGKISKELVDVFKDRSHMPSQFSSMEEVVDMSRVRKAIAQHMIYSRDTAAHVTSVAEADVTNLANWRDRNKNLFFERYGVKLTYTPIFIKILAGLLRTYPYINSSVNGDQVILKKYINIGIATALEDHTLIVPVVKNADQYNLNGLATVSQDLVSRARSYQLKPDEIQGGTFTLTNIGTFGNLMGTPIINQPEVAILATGAIVKKPSVIETDQGDLIGVRQKMYLSLSYDHRIIDGYMGGSFLKAVSDALENFDEEDL